MKNIELINIAKQFGTPIYVYDSDKIKSQFFRLKNAFKSIHNLRINYAVKASPNISILKFLNNLGAGLDTVSIQEVELGLKAGFNPNAAVSLWKKMSKLKDKETNEFFSTHPSSENRISKLQKLIPAANKFYMDKSIIRGSFKVNK